MTRRNGGYIALPGSAEAHTEGNNLQNSTAQDPLLLHRNVKLRGTFELQPDGHTYTYTYGPKGIPGLLHNYYALLCAFFASIGGLTFGYDQGVIANVLVMSDFMSRWPITPLQKGSMTAVLELGALVGALGAGTLADRYSRRHSIFTACVVFCIGSAFQCGAQSLSHLFVGRAIGGVGVGALSMLSPLYMAEISPPEVRGSLMALEQFSIVLGVVFGFWTGFLTRSIPSSASWRIPLAVQLAPGAILGLGCFFLPPSPRLLVLHGRYDDALQSLARLRLRTSEEAEDDPLLQVELLEMRVEATLVQHAIRDGNEQLRAWNLEAELRGWRRLFQRKYLDRTMVGVLIMVFQQWSGINALLYYGPTLVRSIGLHDETVPLLVSGGVGIVQFFAVIPAILYIDRSGRKPLLRIGSALMAASHLIIALLISQFESDWAAHSTAAWTAVAAIYTFTAAYGVSFGPVGWVLPSEVFPVSMRSKGVALSTASNWINNFLIGLVTPIIMEFSASATFMTFAVACALAYFWSTYFIPETANVSLEEIDALFNAAAGREDAELKQQIEQDLGLRDLIRELGAELETA
ncbi:putative major facilitator superfamily, sugar transporter (TC 2.A.1.1) family protein [Lyophyllum shimeji]|uniref:Major facilitator superfamily, sugar transporter (TC 2.A.1.1) family protein n=1 Tax=Lyophyllum shimeji TaxID=47721 RepID=A0A9P3PM93_LYOSH|nr:putative major facilitator superfamily, sugar transporter (TC 2.A.1.1) family protein [Lyophyllum shimeji]